MDHGVTLTQVVWANITEYVRYKHDVGYSPHTPQCLLKQIYLHLRYKSKNPWAWANSTGSEIWAGWKGEFTRTFGLVKSPCYPVSMDIQRVSHSRRFLLQNLTAAGWRRETARHRQTRVHKHCNLSSECQPRACTIAIKICIECAHYLILQGGCFKCIIDAVIEAYSKFYIPVH